MTTEGWVWIEADLSARNGRWTVKKVDDGNGKLWAIWHEDLGEVLIYHEKMNYVNAPQFIAIWKAREMLQSFLKWGASNDSIEEPLGLGAVVETRTGEEVETYIRTDPSSDCPWFSPDKDSKFSWGKIVETDADVRVLSTGVES